MATPLPAETNPEFEALLIYLKRTRGFDFTGYKRTSLMRRILRRMQTVNIETFTDYIDYLEVHPDEFASLFDTILINVTSFFRDRPAWDYISSDIIPQIIASKPRDEPIRIWCAGVASGEEAYTIAMLMAEVLSIDQFRDRVKIYASDVDERALADARQATYNLRQVAIIPAPFLEKYFECTDQHCTFRKNLRRAVIFGRHDLVQDAPISRIDLLICRNALMYFNAEVQSRILSRFHFAVNENGFLMLGKAEMLFSHADLFTPVDLHRRVFTKVPRVTMRDRLLTMTQAGDEEAATELKKHVRFREAAFDTSPVAQTIIDLNGFLVLANERARSLLAINAKDIDRPLQELDFIYRVPELRTRIDEVRATRRPVILAEIDWETLTGDIRTIETQLIPLLDASSDLLGVSITFADVSRARRLQFELEQSNQKLETASEELQSTNEELETTNEELQSTNEELETMNEELQSANEELQTINEELRHRTDELNQVNAYLESILTSLRSAVVVVDHDLRIQVWSSRAEDLWGLRPSEVEGKNFLALDIGLPVEQLKASLRACLAQEGEFFMTQLTATNRRGKTIQCRVICTPLHGVDKEQAQGVILLMEDGSDLR